MKEIEKKLIEFLKENNLSLSEIRFTDKDYLVETIIEINSFKDIRVSKKIKNK